MTYSHRHSIQATCLPNFKEFWLKITGHANLPDNVGLIICSDIRQVPLTIKLAEIMRKIHVAVFPLTFRKKLGYAGLKIFSFLNEFSLLETCKNVEAINFISCTKNRQVMKFKKN